MLLVVGPLSGILLLVIFSLFIPILLPRTILWATAPLAVLAGIGIASLSVFISAPIMVLSAVGLLLLGQAKMEQRALWRSDYRGLQHVAERDANALAATVDGERACIMAFYGQFSGRVRLLDLEDKQVFKRTQKVELGCNDPPPLRVNEMRRRLIAGETIWILGSTDPSDERQVEIFKLSESLAGVARITEHIDEAGFFAARFEAAQP